MEIYPLSFQMRHKINLTAQIRESITEAIPEDIHVLIVTKSYYNRM